MKHTKKIKWLILFIVIYCICTNIWIESTTKKLMYNDTSSLPSNKVGLLLGTSKTLDNGKMNLYYQYRLNAAVNLYKAGKIEYILVSGDNSRKDYDEPTIFKKDLIDRGIPEHKIFLDYAGFRTLDSVVRAKEIFGLNNFTIISQKFHNERALYLANAKSINAIGFNAKDVNTQYGIKTRIREYLARVKSSVDIICNVSPKYLGQKIEIK